jgi:hypothetical protein
MNAAVGGVRLSAHGAHVPRGELAPVSKGRRQDRSHLRSTELQETVPGSTGKRLLQSM